MITDLASLLAPRSVGELERCFVDKRRLFSRTRDPARTASVLPRADLERLVRSDRLPVGSLVAMRDGEVVPVGVYRSPDGTLRQDALDTLVREGVSFVLSGVDDHVPSVARVADSIERRLGHTVWVNAYVTHGLGGALAAHYDDHDVLVLQIAGKKRWFGHGTPSPLPIEPSPDGVDFGPAQWDELLEPGDVLYLPRGEVHHASVEGSEAVHLTFAIDTRRGVDFLHAVVDRAAREVLFREDLTRVSGLSGLGDRERRIKERLCALVAEADIAAYLATDDAARPLRSLLHLGEAVITDESAIIPAVRRPFSWPSSADDTSHQNELEIRAGGRSFRLSVLAARVLALLIASDASTLPEILAKLGASADAAVVRHAVGELIRLELAGVEPRR